MSPALTLDQQGASWAISQQPHRAIGEAIPVEDATAWEWTEIAAPSDILSLLHVTGTIPDPMIAFNDAAVAWVENADWVFRAQFEVPENFLEEDVGISLVLNNLDCWAEVYLNRSKLGSTENQFRERSFLVDQCLIPGPNELIIYIRSAKLVNSALERAHGQLPSGFDTPRVFARRTQCLTGWDWANRLSSASLLSSPRLEHRRIVELESAFAYVRDMAPVAPGAETTEWAAVVIQIDTSTRRKCKAILVGEIWEPGGAEPVARATAPVSLGVGTATHRMSFRIRNARLWWPLGLGRRSGYTLKFSLSGEDRTGKPVSATSNTNTALRKTEIRRQKDAEGESFVPLINSVPVFCRGANWVPASMLPGMIQDEDYLHLVGAAARAGMNCLRVWGGGLYEKDIFYDLCDDLGILVWQDFMFACAAYPTYREFVEEVELEAEYQIRRLRNHPSVLVWCGNNENEWLHQRGELRRGEEKKIIGETLWSSVLKDLAEELDPSRPYQQSSPFGRDRNDYNDMASGDRHNWDCWSGWQSPDAYLVDTGRFISEFGFQSLPSMETIQTFAPGADSLDSPALLHHQRMVSGNERLIRYAAAMYPLPQSLPDWIDCTQRIQAEILRRAVEHWRRRKFRTAGALIWQLNDAYPAASWSLIDFYRRPKLAYEFASRFFAPVLLSGHLVENGRTVGTFDPASDWRATAAGTHADRPTREIGFTLINDTPHEIHGQLEVRLALSGDDLLGTQNFPLSAPANGVSPTILMPLSDWGIEDITTQCLSARLILDGASHDKLKSLSDDISRDIASAATRSGLPYHEVRTPSAEPCDPLTADVLLVEPKFFKWPDSLTVFGQARPSWMP
ncbi:MAG: hypothetical protein K1X53_10010 [Candidatus Sumerlaeaceae bacterium]|nr:hypothetical protein [Candidatus Sumerlaeaceae bacterium]